MTLYHDFGQSGRAIEMLEEQLAKHYASVDLTHINMLADLYMAMVRMGPSVQVWLLFVICSGLFVGFKGCLFSDVLFASYRGQRGPDTHQHAG